MERGQPGEGMASKCTVTMCVALKPAEPNMARQQGATYANRASKVRPSGPLDAFPNSSFLWPFGPNAFDAKCTICLRYPRPVTDIITDLFRCTHKSTARLPRYFSDCCIGNSYSYVRGNYGPHATLPMHS